MVAWTLSDRACYRRDNAVQQLIDETKVWAYWPYREDWLIEYRLAPEQSVGTAVEVLMCAWPRGHAARRQWPARWNHAAAGCAVEVYWCCGRSALRVGRWHCSPR